MKIHFLTGASGFVGKHLTTALLKKKNSNVRILIRSTAIETFITRKKAILQTLPDKYLDRIRILEGDILKQNLGLSEKDTKEMKSNDIVIWHLAANLSFSASNKRSVYETNFSGTAKVTDFANRYAKQLNYVSTAYISGNASKFTETDLYKGQRFRNMYEQSKFEAEKYVREACKISYFIFRPSIIIGDAYSGKAEGCTFGYYRFLFVFTFLKKNIKNVFKKNNFHAKILSALGTKYNEHNDLLRVPWLIFPAPRKSVVDIVTIDFVISSMIKIYESGIKNKIYNITQKKLPTFEFMLKSMLLDLGYRNFRILFLPISIFKAVIEIAHFFSFKYRKYIKSLKWYIPYITDCCAYENKNLYNLVNKPVYITRSVLKRINYYAKSEILDQLKF